MVHGKNAKECEATIAAIHDETGDRRVRAAVVGQGVQEDPRALLHRRLGRVARASTCARRATAVSAHRDRRRARPRRHARLPRRRPPQQRGRGAAAARRGRHRRSSTSSSKRASAATPPPTRSRSGRARCTTRSRRCVGAAPDEIALVESATRAWDMVFYSLASTFAPGDRDPHVARGVREQRDRVPPGRARAPAPGRGGPRRRVTASSRSTRCARCSTTASGWSRSRGSRPRAAGEPGRRGRRGRRATRACPYLLDACQAVGPAPDRRRRARVRLPLGHRAQVPARPAGHRVPLRAPRRGSSGSSRRSSTSTRRGGRTATRSRSATTPGASRAGSTASPTGSVSAPRSTRRSRSASTRSRRACTQLATSLREQLAARARPRAARPRRRAVRHRHVHDRRRRPVRARGALARRAASTSRCRPSTSRATTSRRAASTRSRARRCTTTTPRTSSTGSSPHSPADLPATDVTVTRRPPTLTPTVSGALTPECRAPARPRRRGAAGDDRRATDRRMTTRVRRAPRAARRPPRGSRPRWCRGAQPAALQLVVGDHPRVDEVRHDARAGRRRARAPTCAAARARAPPAGSAGTALDGEQRRARRRRRASRRPRR